VKVSSATGIGCSEFSLVKAGLSSSYCGIKSAISIISFTVLLALYWTQ